MLLTKGGTSQGNLESRVPVIFAPAFALPDITIGKDGLVGGTAARVVYF
jgi:hypothetical protein